jgi:hypothetical protein
MFRTFAIAAILALAATAPVQAEDSLTSRIHDAAVKACAAKVGASLPLTFYGPINAHCVDKVSADAMAKILATRVAKTEASTATN